MAVDSLHSQTQAASIQHAAKEAAQWHEKLLASRVEKQPTRARVAGIYYSEAAGQGWRRRSC